MLRRGSPTHINYVSSEAEFEARSSLVVRAGPTIYMSGIISIRVDGDGYSIVGDGDMRVQMQRIFEIARHALEVEGLRPCDVATYTGYVLSVAQFNANRDVVQDFFGDWAPCGTVVGVAELGWPGLLCEIVLTAVDFSA